MGITLVMGVLVFLVGLAMDVITLLAVLEIPPLGNIGAGERFLLFAGGLILIALGYAMARNLPQPTVTYEEIKPTTAQESGEPTEPR
ncbi:MAG TPA: hypothetical protein VIX58_08070 [Anaerolineae bacterium]